MQELKVELCHLQEGHCLFFGGGYWHGLDGVCFVRVNAYPCFAVHFAEPCNFRLAKDTFVTAKGKALLFQPVQYAGEALVVLPAFTMHYDVILYLYYTFEACEQCTKVVVAFCRCYVDP